MANLEERVELIEKRNKKVEIDKAWETSLARKILITVLTYLVVAAYLKFVVGIDPWINAIVPAVGFLLSTLTLSFAKSLWEKNYKR
ncbi:MAG TPA: hypothetical protein VHE53_00945 [Patescibacteria group bacterium]|nr:hypothetical protein [Patescibacteria group bacterium]